MCKSVADGRATVTCRTLRPPSGWLGGIGRRVSLLFFGSMPAHADTVSNSFFFIFYSISVIIFLSCLFSKYVSIIDLAVPVLTEHKDANFER